MDMLLVAIFRLLPLTFLLVSPPATAPWLQRSRCEDKYFYFEYLPEATKFCNVLIESLNAILSDGGISVDLLPLPTSFADDILLYFFFVGGSTSDYS